MDGEIAMLFRYKQTQKQKPWDNKVFISYYILGWNTKSSSNAVTIIYWAPMTR